MNVVLVCCFYGRVEKVERIIRFFIDQDYKGESTLLLYNNAPYPQKLLLNQELPKNKHIYLINNYLDLQTGGQYISTGDIFRDATSYISPSTDAITFFDSDDCYLPNHISEGVKGLIKAHHLLMNVYKPYNSYFLYGKECQLAHNNLEPSIFVDYQQIIKYGFNKTSSSYHDGWLIPLKENKKLLDDPAGIPTLLYNWEEGHNTFKISGSGDDGPQNLKNHREKEQDFGTGILSPASRETVEYYYNLVKKPINA